MTEKTVLVVDDNPLIVELVREILEGRHYHVLEAHDGLEAIDQTNHHHVDIILMDIRLPFFSGIWFCQVFRTRKNTCNIPVVIISAVMDEANDRKARLAGAVDTVRKPFTAEAILETVEKNSL